MRCRGGEEAPFLFHDGGVFTSLEAEEEEAVAEEEEDEVETCCWTKCRVVGLSCENAGVERISSKFLMMKLRHCDLICGLVVCSRMPHTVLVSIEDRRMRSHICMICKS